MILGQRIFKKIESNPLILSIRSGLVMIIPVLMAGAFALILKSFPVPAYIAFIQSFAGGLIYNIFDFIYNATFGMLSVYMTISVGYSMSRESKYPSRNMFGAPIASLATFLIFTGFATESWSRSSFGPVGMFTAIICSTTASALYLAISRRMRGGRIFSDGADPGFNKALTAILPLSIVVILYAAVNFLIHLIFGADNFMALIVRGFDLLFEHLGGDFFGSFIYIFASSVLWFFGIHGSDVLEVANLNIFTPAANANAAAAAAGAAPTAIYTKTFFDVFILMGGCGMLLSLLIALLLFSRRKSSRSLAKIAAFPMLFNINEIMVFGLPIIYNPIMLIPFIAAPAAAFLISSAALSLGLVPLTTVSVEWTTPIILGGYQATGSVAGAVLQLVNIAAGVLIYMPFVKMYDRKKERDCKQNLAQLVAVLHEHEAASVDVTLTELSGVSGEIAKQLASDLKNALTAGELYLAYQPQFDREKRMNGAEALLRWAHPVFGSIYPPLIIKLAAEADLLHELESGVFRRAKRDIDEYGIGVRVSVNITPSTLRGDISFITDTFPIDPNICIEITEQSRLITDSDMRAAMARLKSYGFKLAIDDFSMGFTSLNYLRDCEFDEVKLDGSLVRGLTTDANTKDIIASIVYLSNSIGFTVLAEYVETEEQKELLEQAGCMNYQGWLFSPAVSPGELAAMEKKQSA